MKNSRTGRDLRVDGRTPGRVVPLREGLRRDGVDIGAFRTEVIVDDVEQHHEAGGMGGVDERLQVVRAAIGVGRREGQHAVIAPVPPARESGDRHDLDGGDAEIDQMAELADGRAKGAFRREGADVQLVDDRLLPWAAGPGVVAPDIGGRIDDHAGAVHVLRLMARSRIGNPQAVRQDEAVARAGTRLAGDEFVPSVVDRLHGMASRTIIQLEQDGFMRRRPEPESDRSIRPQFRAERHFMCARHVDHHLVRTIRRMSRLRFC